MKKVLAVLLCAVMIISLSACGGKKSDAKSGEKTAVSEAPKFIDVTEDTDAMNLHFTPPAGYESAERVTGKDAKGNLTEKSFNYTFADSSSVMVGYTVGKNASDTIPQKSLESATSATYAGKQFKVIEEGSAFVALCEEGNVIYGIGYSFAKKADGNKAEFEDFMSNISFTKASETQEDDDDLFGITYDAKAAGNMTSRQITVTKKADGTLTKKAVSWHYGKDEENLDYRFLIRVYKDTTVDAQKTSGNEYEEKVINGITYTVRKMTNGEKPCEYFTQHGKDVYKIYNNGVVSGWGVTRSEQSQTAFENFVKSIKF